MAVENMINVVIFGRAGQFWILYAVYLKKVVTDIVATLLGICNFKYP